jgi:Mg2+/citrate symporter
MNEVNVNEILYQYLTWVVLALLALEVGTVALVLYYGKKKKKEPQTMVNKNSQENTTHKQFPVMQIIPQMQLQSRQELLDDENGKWLRDIAKYLATVVLFTSMFQDIENKAVAYAVGIGLAVALFTGGTWYMKKNRKNKNDENKDKNNNIHSKTK